MDEIYALADQQAASSVSANRDEEEEEAAVIMQALDSIYATADREFQQTSRQDDAMDVDEVDGDEVSVIYQSVTPSSVAVPAPASTVPAATHVCRLCDARFKTRIGLARHARSAHSAQPLSLSFNRPPTVSAPDAQRPQKTTYKCPFCDKPYTRPAFLKKHISTKHAGDEAQRAASDVDVLIRSRARARAAAPPSKPFFMTCPKCPKQFRKNYCLDKHLKVAHGDSGRFVCPRCRASFNEHEALRLHFSHRHIPERLCDRCGKLFRCEADQDSHEPFCHGPWPSSFRCVFCSSVFPTITERNRHWKKCERRREQMQLFHGAGGSDNNNTNNINNLGQSPLREDEEDEEDEEEDEVQNEIEALSSSSDSNHPPSPPPPPSSGSPPSQNSDTSVSSDNNNNSGSGDASSSHSDEEEGGVGSSWTSSHALGRDALIHTLALENYNDLNLCLIEKKQTLEDKLRSLLHSIKDGLKWWLVALVRVSKEQPGRDGQVDVQQEEKALRSRERVLLPMSEPITEQMGEAILEVVHNAELLQCEGSAWVVSEVIGLELRTAVYVPIQGGSFIPTPRWLSHVRSLVNIENHYTHDCFRLSVIAGLRPELVDVHGHRNRAALYVPYVDQLNMGDINYRPMSVKDIPRFEQLNPTVSITVLAPVEDDQDEDLIAEEAEEAEEEEIVTAIDEDAALGEYAAAYGQLIRDRLDPLVDLPADQQDNARMQERRAQLRKHRIIPVYCPSVKKENHITLLLLTSERDPRRSHYVLVKNVHAFLSSVRRSRNLMHFCTYCMAGFRDGQQRVIEHEKTCSTLGVQAVEFTGGHTHFDSKQFHRIQRSPFTVFFDFEAVLPSTVVGNDDASDSEEEEELVHGRTRRTQRHVPVAFCLIAVNHRGELVETIVRHGSEGDDVAGISITEMFALEQRLNAQRPNHPLHMTREQARAYMRASKCYLCKEGFKERVPSLKKCRDHDHLEPRANYRGACHVKCNSAVKIKPVLNFWAHNNFKYDFHLICDSIMGHPLMAEKRVSLLPFTHDHYRSVRIFVGEGGRSIRFQDSLQFITSSLDEISSSLKDADLGLLQALYVNDEEMRLLRRKGVYPYEFANSYEHMIHTRDLPTRDQFYSSLSESTVSEEDYQRAQEVWRGMRCENLLDYCLHYLRTDTILLACFVMKFKQVIFKKYQLEIDHVVSSSSLTLCAMLKWTEVKIERVTDPDMHAMLTAAAKGGYSAINTRYAEANVPGTSTHKPEDPSKHIMLLDVNALYALEMTKPLPIGGYRWLDSERLHQIDWQDLKEDDPYGYIVEVDLEYPPEIHEAHSEFPCAVERIEVPREWYSPLQERMAEACGMSATQAKQPKLISHLGPRQNYIVHGHVLAEYLKRGLKLITVRRGIVFRQEAYLRDYILDLAEERKRAVHQFESLLWKFLGNALYGQLLRNPRKDRKVDLVTTRRRFRKLVSKPNFKSFTIFGDDLVAVERRPSVIKLDNLVAAGVTVLDRSKKTMLELYWRLKSHFQDRMELLFTDTDSLGLLLTTPDLGEDFAPLSDILDLSGFPRDHPLYDGTHARVPGRLKVEYGDFHILRFAGVRSKVYALDLESRGQQSVVYKCKGVQRGALKRHVSFEDYKRCVFNSATKEVTFSSIRTDGKHHIYTMQQTKKALQNCDNKRYILPDGIHTRAFGFRTH